MMSDEEGLPERLATDLDRHFEDLVRLYQDRLYSFALRLTGNAQESEEAVQDALVRAYRALGRYPEQQRRDLRLRPWLYQITLNVVRNRSRRLVLPTVDVDGPPGPTIAARYEEQPEPIALEHERRSRLAAALVTLPPRFATAVVLRHVQGLSYAEIAAVVGQPLGTVKSDVHRGLRLLRLALEPELLLEAAGSH